MFTKDSSPIIINNYLTDNGKLDEIIKLLQKMSKELDELIVEVEETKGIMKSAKVLIEGFAAALAAAGTDPVKLAALKADLNTGGEELAAALVANPLPGEVVTPPPVTPPGQ